MIIVLDSSALIRGARFDKSVADAKARGLRVVVPRLVALDVANRYRKESADMIAALSVQARMYDRLGLRRDLTRFIDAAHDKADGYVQDLVDDLQGIGIEVLDPVDVPHLLVAERAIAMQRPYVDKKKRDGYPATLNWLTLLDLADRNPGTEILWVSDDTRAFGDTQAGSWHPDLLRELDSRWLDGRVRWALEFPVFDGPAQVEPRVVSPVLVEVNEREVPQVVEVAELVEVAEPVEVAGVVEAAVPTGVAVPVVPAAAVVPAVPVVPTVPVAPTPKPVQRAARTRVAPQRIPPAPKPPSGGLRNLGKVIGGRKRKVTIVEDLDEVDLSGN